MTENGWSVAWFVSRFILGLVLDFILLFGTVIAVIKTFIFFGELGQPANSLLMSLMVLAACLAGRSYLRGRYVSLFLSEIIHLPPEEVQ